MDLIPKGVCVFKEIAISTTMLYE